MQRIQALQRNSHSHDSDHSSSFSSTLPRLALSLALSLLLLVASAPSCADGQTIYYPDIPVVWGFGGATGQPSSGGGVITITGQYFLEVGQCTADPILQFDYGGTNQVACVATGSPVQTGSWLKCIVPPGCGAPKVKVNICGQVARDLPRASDDLTYFYGAKTALPVDSNYCSSMVWSGSTTWSSAVNWICSSDSKQKMQAVGSPLAGSPMFAFKTGTPGSPDNMPDGSPATCTLMTMRTTALASPAVPAASYAATWNSAYNRICVPTGSPYRFNWSMSGALPSSSYSCLVIAPTGDTAWGSSIYQLCAQLGVSPYPVPDTSLLYRYMAPTISSISPPNGPTAGGVAIVLTGQSFGYTATTSVTVNGIDCPVTASNHTSITCTLPPGNGAVSLVKVTSCAIPGAIATFAYDGPVVTSVSPTLLATVGGTVLTIGGMNFGLTGSVTVNSQACALTGAYSTTQIQCVAPSGVGKGIPVAVTSGGKTSAAFSVDYLAPSVTALWPSSYDTLPGSTVLTVTGSNFGTAGSVTVGGTSCPLTGTGYAQNTVQCTLPAGQGLLQMVVVTAAAQSNAGFPFNYTAPSITSISPSGGAAGLSVTLRGSSFGIGTATQVFMNGVAVTMLSLAQKSVTFAVPAGSGGINLAVWIVVAGQVSANYLNFSYAAVVTGAATSAGSGNPTQGGVPLQLTGVNFNNPQASITVGGAACAWVAQNDSYIVCTLPAGSGTGNAVIVTTVTGLVSNSYLFDYDPPQLYGFTPFSPQSGPTAGGNSIYLYGTSLGNSPQVSVHARACVLVKANSTYVECTVPAGTGATNKVLITAGAYTSASFNYAYYPPYITGISPSNGPTSGGTSVTLRGTNLGSQLAIVATAGSIVTPSLQNDTTVVYASPAGSNLQYVNLLVDSQASNGVQFQYDYAVVTGVSPTSGRTDGGSPTQTVLTITGTGFSSSGYVTVGSVQATSTGTGYSNTRIQVLLPAGQGHAPIVVVTASSGVGSAPFPFTYNLPNITSVSPSSAATSGGVLITLTGTDFGSTATGAGTVYVGAGQCTTASPGTSWAYAKIVCLLAAGQGANLAVKLTVSGLSPATTPTFSYLPPSITNLLPQSGPTLGGQAVTLYGSNFGLVATVSFVDPVGGPWCTLSGLGQSHTQIVCTVPPGQGLLVPVQVNVSGQLSASSAVNQYNYNQPSIYSLSPATSPTQGGAVLTLSGLNFGTSFSFVSLSLGPYAVRAGDIVSFNQSQIVFRSSRGSGQGYVVALVVGGQGVAAGSSSASFAFRYDAPTLSSISGCAEDVYPAAKGCSIGGGATLRINGTNFGNDSSLVSVSVGPGAGLTTCTSVAILVVDTALSCVLQANSAGGFNLNVNVTVNTLVGGAALLSFAGPIITPNTLQATVSGTPSTALTLTTDPSASSPFSVQFSGRNFGSALGDVTVTYGVAGSSTKIYSCAPTYVSTDAGGSSVLRCGIGEGVGSKLVFVVKVLGLLSTEGTDTVSFAAAAILPDSIRAAPGLSRQTSYTGSATEGDQVVFDVSHLPASAAAAGLVKVWYGHPGGPYDQACTGVSMGVESSASIPYVTCVTSPGTGSGFVFVLWALNTPSNVGTDVYNYVVAPTIFSVHGCTDSGNVTTGCPTAGGVTLTIDGQYFGQLGLSVQVGASACASVVFVSSTRVTCVLGVGAGLTQGVTVIVKSLFSRTQPFLSYADAYVTAVSGCTDSGSSTTNCPRAGGTVLTVFGSNFGPPPALVLVGGVQCGSVTASASNPQGQLTCVLSSGTQTLRSIILIQQGGTLSIGLPTVGYTQCPAGSSAPVGQIACNPCSMGTYADQAALTACINCAAGTFGSTTGLTQCSACSAGSYSLVGSTTGAQNCTSCDVGKYNDGSGSSYCSSCDMGTFANVTGQTACTSCPAGKYTDQTQQTVCFDCYPGTYYSFTGAVQCSNCPAGTATDQYGRTACSDCLAGTSAATAGLTACTACQQGTFSGSTRQASCLACDAGTFSNTTSLSACYPCLPGSYSTKEGSLGATTCASCSAGTYTNVPAQPACLICPKGSAATTPGSSTCTACTAGFYSNADTGYSSCSPCAAGTYTSASGTVNCLSCGVGTYASGLNSTSCISCPAGSVQPSSGQTGCVLCAQGLYQSNPGQAACVACDSGSFANGTGQTACSSCATGKFSVKVSGAAVGAISCSDCSAGKYTDIGAQTSCFSCQPGSAVSYAGAASCPRCPVGQSQPDSGQTSCSNCTSGTFSSSLGALACTSCLAGTYGTDDGQSVCTPCPPGQRQPTPGLTFCSACGSGYYSSLSGQSECQPCPAGSYSGPGASLCSSCSPGTFQELAGQSSCAPCAAGTSQGASGSTFCPQCAAGSATSLTQQSTCAPCPVGTFTSSSGALTCTSCTAGSFAASPGKLVCDKCPLGRFSGSDQATTCSSCDYGYFASSAGLSQCASCSSGRYAPVQGSVVCLPCPSGTFGPGTGLAICENCLPGQFQSTTGEAACVTCPAGTVTSASGSIACASCSAGYYQNDLYTECLACPIGYFQSDPQKNFCNACPLGTYTAVEGQASCSSCPAGTARDSYDVLSCTECAAGYFQSAPGSLNCSTCAAGSYQALQGQASCLSCPAGSISSGPGATTCTQCPQGKFQSQTGQFQCLDCAPGEFNINPGQSACSLCLPGRPV